MQFGQLSLWPSSLHKRIKVPPSSIYNERHEYSHSRDRCPVLLCNAALAKERCTDLAQVGEKCMPKKGCTACRSDPSACRCQSLNVFLKLGRARKVGQGDTSVIEVDRSLGRSRARLSSSRGLFPSWRCLRLTWLASYPRSREPNA